MRTLSVADELEARRSAGRAAQAVRRLASGAAVPASLYLAATLFYAWAAARVSFAVNEGSAYYVAVARNLATGRGLVSDALWSYSTPPLALPRPAFELWQPLASFIAAAPMAVIGPGLGAAQLGTALVAGMLAPLAWLMARDACARLGYDARRTWMLAAGSAVTVAFTGPLVVAVSLPDSTIPFAVAAVACSIVLARALTPAPDRPVARSLPWLALGVLLGVAWLARHEAVWIGLVALSLGLRTRTLDARTLGAVVIGGLLVAGPWMARNLVSFGTPLPGQAIDNVLLTANEQIFAFMDRPTVEAFLGQGAATLVGNVAGGAWHNVVNALAVPAAPVALAGLAGALMLARRPELRRSALVVALAVGSLILVATTLLFPIATRWGTFEHASGPLVVSLAVAAVLGVDRMVQAVGRRRAWRRSNAWLAPLAVAGLSLPLSVLLVAGLAAEARVQSERWSSISQMVTGEPALFAPGAVVLTDHPIWFSDATGLPAAALPAEVPAAVGQLADALGARVVLLTGERGGYPALFDTVAGRQCFERVQPASAPPGVVVATIRAGCR